MPAITPADQMLLHISTCKKAAIDAFPVGGGRHPFPLAQLVQQVISDRLILAGEHLRAGDQLLFATQYRSAISRHYYAMYQAARAIVFAETRGDDYERHSILPRKLPPHMKDAAIRENELTDARLLRNQADYDIYPIGQSDWEDEARQLAVTSAEFVQACEDFASGNGHI
ncbi:hypothetical protein AB0H88_45840 [Nonomuraea sp. NPDC050680]|uniref:hypothetical protein n=1 Tax=Nonomuraea sp. NPDC050680 TaxID=3154630 RepID=UPI0033F100C9